MRTPPSLWTTPAPLVLASKSASRRALLTAARLPHEIVAGAVDERAIEEAYLAAGGPVFGLAGALAAAKALAASALRPEAYCLGADQTLTVEGRLVHKPAERAAAERSLGLLQGRVHRLTAAFAIARAGRILVADEDVADLAMRRLDAGEIARYLDRAGAGVLASVGVYQLEALGVHLFDRIAGEHSTILGLPMLKLLAFLRAEGLVAL